MPPRSGVTQNLETAQGLCRNPPQAWRLTEMSGLPGKVSAMLHTAPLSAQGHWVPRPATLPTVVTSLSPRKLGQAKRSLQTLAP